MAVMTELVALEQERRAKRPAELQAVMDQATDDLAASGMAGGFLQAGHVAPDFVLPDVLGNVVALADLRTQGPVVLSFYRGAWCPYCNLEVQLLQQALPDIQALGGNTRRHLAADARQLAHAGREARPGLPRAERRGQRRGAPLWPGLHRAGCVARRLRQTGHRHPRAQWRRQL